MSYKNQANMLYQNGKRAKAQRDKADKVITATVAKLINMEKIFLIDNPCEENKKRFQENKEKLNDYIKKQSSIKENAEKELNKCINELQKLAKKVNTDLGKYGSAYKDNAFTASSLNGIDRYAKKQMREAANSAKSKSDELSHLFVLIQKFIKDLNTDHSGVIPSTTPYESIGSVSKPTNDFSGITGKINIHNSIDDIIREDTPNDNWERLLKGLEISSKQYTIPSPEEMEFRREEGRKQQLAAQYYYYRKNKQKSIEPSWLNKSIDDTYKSSLWNINYVTKQKYEN